MATTTTRKRTPSTRSATRSRRRPTVDDGAIASLQQVIEELDRMRAQASDDLREQLDPVVQRMRRMAGDLRERGEEQASEVERAVSRVADEAWAQIAILAVRAQHDPEALTALSAEIRKRKAQLRPPAKRAAKSSAAKTAAAESGR